MIFCKKEIVLYFSFLLINSLLAQTSSTIDQIDTTWWYDNYSEGLRYLDSDDLGAAEKEFRKILEKDDDIAHAYYGLGRVYDKLEQGNKEAIKNYREAIDLNPDFIEAYYYLGHVYEYLSKDKFQYRDMSSDCFYAVIKKDPHFIDGWIALARLREISDWPPTPDAAETFAEALKFNPGNKKVYQLFRQSVFWNSVEDISLPTFQFLIQQNPLIAEYAFDYAQALYNLDRYESCLDVLDTLEIFHPDYSPCKINLLRAKIHFNTDEKEKGLINYWQAINSIRDSSDANVIYSDISYIINNSEVEDYQSTPIRYLTQFYARFWLSRDPNLATNMNERLVEHYKRLKYARKNYRRYISDQANRNILLYRTDHPLYGTVNVKLGDDLLNPLVSGAIPANRDLDDMGIIYLRHGEPDKTAFYICDSCLQNISWKYYARKDRSELIFHFTKHGTARSWSLESVPSYFENRYDFGALYAQLDPTVSPNQDYLHNLSMFETVNDQDIEHAKVGVQTETSDYVYENPLIEFPLTTLFFKDKNSKTKVDLFYGIEGTHHQLDSTEYGNLLSYATFTGFFDEKWNEILRFTNEYYVPINVDQDRWKSSSFVNMENFSVQPGEYNYEFQLQDKVSDNLGVHKGILNIPDYGKNELMLSDIILSGPVVRKTESSRFKKGDISFSPHMFTVYEKGETVGFYVEIYNLLYDSSDRTNFEVTWLLIEEGTDETEAEVVRSTLPYSGAARDDKIYFNLELSDTDSGVYELVILVKDMTSDVEVSKKVRLTVL